MTSKWPAFITKDLGPDDDDEMMRRWEVYNREMKALIAKGGFHQDADGWWVETATGKLVGPDPEIERPDEIREGKPLKEVLPDLHEAIKRSRGRPRKKNPKAAVTLRIDPRTLDRWERSGDDWRSRMAGAIENAAP
ncbi:MAG: BrnA antitoxin family protein [Nitratireductor sp.]|nr:BrnA antitoxin family protein [Nitratireductor sp.]